MKTIPCSCCGKPSVLRHRMEPFCLLCAPESAKAEHRRKERRRLKALSERINRAKREGNPFPAPRPKPVSLKAPMPKEDLPTPENDYESAKSLLSFYTGQLAAVRILLTGLGQEETEDQTPKQKLEHLESVIKRIKRSSKAEIERLEATLREMRGGKVA